LYFPGNRNSTTKLSKKKHKNKRYYCFLGNQAAKMQNRNTKRIFPCEEILLDPIIPIPINKGRVKTGGS